MSETSNNKDFHILTAKAFSDGLNGQKISDSSNNIITFIKENRIIIENIKVIEDFELNNCKVELPLIIRSGEFEFIEINNVSFLKKFEIVGGLFKGNFNIYNSEFHDDFIINGGSFQYDFYIGSGIFHKEFFINNGAFLKYFWIDGGKFQKELNINNGEFNGDFWISQGEFQDQFIIEGGEFKDTLFISGGKFQNDFNVFNGIFNKINILHNDFKRILIQTKKGSFINKLKFNTEIVFDLKINNSNINHIEFTNILRSSGSIYVKGLSINELIFNEFENEGRISITDVSSGGRYFILEIIENKIRNQFKIGQSNETSKFSLINCDIGNVSFFNMNFMSFGNLIIRNSRINDIKTITNHIPVSNEKIIYTDESGKQESHNLEELYNQLYLAMQKQGNRTQEIKYYAEYLEWHRKNKLIKLKEYGFFYKIFKQDWYTPLSLWLHKNSSNYGINWVRSLILVLISGIILYSLYALSLGFKYFNIDYFGFHLRYFFEFLNPTHKIELIPNTNPNGLPVLWDILGRIVIGFLIYQTIAAFRRFGRK